MNIVIDLVKILWSKLWFKVGIVLLLIAFVFFLVISLTERSPSLSIYKTNLTSETINTLNDNLVIYNGLSFYQVDPINNSEPKVIYTPNFRLPTPSKIIWSENGVLLNFSEGINYSPVEEYMTNHNIPFFSSNGYMTWYLDFTDGSFTMIDNSEIASSVSEDFAVYDKKSSGFYYITTNEDSTAKQLKFYETASQESKVIIEALTFDPVSLTACDATNSINTGGGVCIVGIDYDNPLGKISLYSVSKDGSLTNELNETGQIMRTPDRNIFLWFGDDEIYDDIGVMFKSVSVVNIADDSTVKFSGNVIDNTVAVSKANESYILTDGDNTEFAFLNNGKLGNIIRWTNINMEDQLDLQKGFITSGNFSSQSFILIKDLTSIGNRYIITTKQSSQKFFKQSADILTKNLNDCISGYEGARVELDGSSVTVLINYEQLTSDLSKIKKCISGDQKNLTGYTYQFKGIDIIHDKLVTD